MSSNTEKNNILPLPFPLTPTQSSNDSTKGKILYLCFTAILRLKTKFDSVTKEAGKEYQNRERIALLLQHCHPFVVEMDFCTFHLSYG